MKKSSLLLSLGSAAALTALTGCASSSGAEKADAPAAEEAPAEEAAAPAEEAAAPAEAAPAEGEAAPAAEGGEAGAEASCGEGSCG